ncbi:MAG: hypothetical protein OEW15_06150 [Nitrospirota bacterium]|nr:hypothetical protein [Nitrospirota bacterium]
MHAPTFAAYLFTVLTAFAVLFQFALALGAPWGTMTMGGKFPGQLPPRMRIAALVQIVVLVFAALVVLSRAGIIISDYSTYSRSAIWFVVAFSLVATVLNSITPSKKERMLWAPISIILLVCAAFVAMS